MNQDPSKRKLSAILSADVVGYSRLMEADEAWTIQSLEENKKLMTSLIIELNGRVVDSPGDNLLAEFSSVINAVECAVKVQEQLNNKNSKLMEDNRMHFRIGVNLGDVVEEEGRLYGNGVNIAARLEELAEPGGICISHTAYDQVKNKVNVEYDYLGEYQVKNINEPVRAYRIIIGLESSKKYVPHGKSKKIINPLNIAIAIIILLLVALVTTIATFVSKPSEPRNVIRYYYELPLDHRFVTEYPPVMAVSPNGTQFVYSTTKGLYVKTEGELEAKFIIGTNEITQAPFFSPDGQWIGYHSLTKQKLKKISINGGAPESLCDVETSSGSNWSEDNMILYSEFGGSPIMRVSANGGKPEIAVETDAQLLQPQIMPDGNTVIFTQRVNNKCHVFAQSIESGERKVLFPGHSATYLPTGHIVYAIKNNLFAVEFDLDNVKVIGREVLVIEGVFTNPEDSITRYVVSDSGTLVYIPTIESEVTKNTLVWVNRNGEEEPLGTTVGIYNMPNISPDGKFVALCIAGENADIWTLDLERDNNTTRLTRDESNDYYPIWTPDGKRIVYHCSGKKRGIYWKNADGTGQAEPLITAKGRTFSPYSWSSDGKNLALDETPDAVTRYDISLLSIEGKREKKPLMNEDYIERAPQISPDGQWIAYYSNESGKNEIYVRPFPDVDKFRTQASTAGGFAPLWAPDGKELFYINKVENEVEVMSVKLETEPAIKLDSPKRLFKGAYKDNGYPWDIHPDGKRFIMIKNLKSTVSESHSSDRPKIIIVKNWFKELEEKMSKE